MKLNSTDLLYLLLLYNYVSLYFVCATVRFDYLCLNKHLAPDSGHENDPTDFSESASIPFVDLTFAEFLPLERPVVRFQI